MQKTTTAPLRLGLLAFLLFSLAQGLFSQSLAPEASQSLVQTDSARLQRESDFNYEFFPNSVYLRVTKQAGFDSLTQTFKILRDTANSNTPVGIKKEGSVFTIRNLQRLSTPVYSANVEYLGLANRNDGSLLYRARTQEQETIIVNPVQGWALLFFEANCGTAGRKPNDCDSQAHYFGSNPTTVEQFLASKSAKSK